MLKVLIGILAALVVISRSNQEAVALLTLITVCVCVDKICNSLPANIQISIPINIDTEEAPLGLGE